MRRLILMRHAKAEKAAAGQDDFDRALSEGGRADAALMGKVLADAGLAIDRALVSSALRTRQTWEGVAASFPQARPVIAQTLYLAGPGVLLQAIEDEDDAEGLILIAHNPGVHALALQLLINDAAPMSIMARVQRGFPTASCVAFAIDEAGRATYDGLFLAAEHGGGGGE